MTSKGGHLRRHGLEIAWFRDSGLGSVCCRSAGLVAAGPVMAASAATAGGGGGPIEPTASHQ